MKKLPHVTRRESVEIRGVHGQPILEFFQQGQAILERSAPNHLLSQFFAEPQLHLARGEIAWYTKAQGAVLAFSSMDEVQRAELLKTVRAMRQQIAAIADRFSSEGGTAASTRAEIFKTMLSETDSVDCLYLVGEQPVLCEWGCKRLGVGSQGDTLWTYGSALRTLGSDDGAMQEIGAQSGTPLVSPAQVSVSGSIEPAQPEINAGRSETQKGDLADEDSPSAEGPRAPAARPGPELGRLAPSPPPAPPRQPPPPAEHLNRSPTPGEHSRQRQASPALPPRGASAMAGPQSRWGAKVWSFIKTLIVLALLLALLLTLLRGCDSPSTLPLLTTAQHDAEEARLRREIAALRSEADRVLANCPVR